MGKIKSQIQIKKEEREAALAAVAKALKSAKEKEKSKWTGCAKRKDNAVLARYIRVPLTSCVRPPEAHASKTYNLARQVIGLVDHAFVRYPVPLFLYRAILTNEGIGLVFGEEVWERGAWKQSGKATYVRWFMIAAQGGSLAREMKDLMSKREVHWFLQAPHCNTIQRNLFWARCAAAGISPGTCQLLTERLGSKAEIRNMGDRLPDVLRFYATYEPFMGKAELQEITDFVRAMIDVREFSFKGRTLGSMQKLSHAWHNYTYSGSVGVYVSWAQTYAGWEQKIKGFIVRVVELTNNRSLGDEGRKQRHCVFGYADYCAQGFARIVSIRWLTKLPDELGSYHEHERLTLEIRPKEGTIVQIRGKLNRRATDEEMRVIRLWAGEHGLIVSERW